MSKSRRLRRLVPDEKLYERRAAGESLRSLAPDYAVLHSTLSRHFRKPEAKLELREAQRRLRGVSKAVRAEEQRMKQDARARAREERERDRLLEAYPPPDRVRRSDYAGWLDEHDAPRGLHSRARYSESDHLAERVVEAGGGVEQISDATGLNRKNLFNNIRPQILVRALANDTKFPSNARPDDRALRRLVPTSELIRRRAAGETLRSLAADYNVCHTTLSRYFNRPGVAKQLRAQQRRHPARRPSVTMTPK